MTQFNLLVGTSDGTVIEVTELSMAGMDLVKPLLVPPDAVIDLPAGLPVEVLPGRVAMGYDEDLGRSVRLHEYQGKRVFAVGAVLSSPFIQQLRPAFTTELDAERLTGKSIAAVGGCDGHYIVAALSLPPAGSPVLRLPLATGISAEKLAKLLPTAGDAGEAAMQTVCLDALAGNIAASALADIIGGVRSKFAGSLQLRHSGTSTADFGALAAAGIDEFIFPVNSLQEDYYNAFHAQQGGSFCDLTGAVETLREGGSRVALQYQCFPGLTDHPREFQKLLEWTAQHGVQTLHLCDLAVDPEWYIEELSLSRQERSMFGMREWWERIRSSGLQICAAAG